MNAIDEALATEAQEQWRETVRQHRSILNDVLQERRRQVTKWGVQQHEGDRWNAILGEERGEIEHSLNELTEVPDLAAGRRELANLRTEIVQTAAVCVAWLLDWDTRGVFDQ